MLSRAQELAQRRSLPVVEEGEGEHGQWSPVASPRFSERGGGEKVVAVGSGGDGSSSSGSSGGGSSSDSGIGGSSSRDWSTESEMKTGIHSEVMQSHELDSRVAVERVELLEMLRDMEEQMDVSSASSQAPPRPAPPPSGHVTPYLNRGSLLCKGRSCSIVDVHWPHIVHSRVARDEPQPEGKSLGSPTTAGTDHGAPARREPPR